MSNVEVATRFVRVWSQNSLRALPELRSLHNETNRKPDNYHFVVGKEGLIDSETGLRVSDFIDTSSSLGKVEFSVLKKLEEWSQRVDEGIGYWISPALEGKYPCAKAIISQIAYSSEGQKVLLNSAILFDATPAQCLEIVSQENISYPELLRQTLIVSPDDPEILGEFLARLEKYSAESPSNNQETNTEIFFQMIQRGTPAEEIVARMEKTGFLGKFAISCPPNSQTFSEFMLSRSQVFSLSGEGKFVKKCGNCGAEINAHICKGFRCASCGGVYEGC